MLRSVLAFAAALGLASPAMADGLYLNPEYNSSYTPGEYLGATLEPHIGYENGAWYIQGGPALLDDSNDYEMGVSGKTGVNINVDPKTDLYGELSFAKYKNEDVNYGVKMGIKAKL